MVQIALTLSLKSGRDSAVKLDLALFSRGSIFHRENNGTCLLLEGLNDEIMPVKFMTLQNIKLMFKVNLSFNVSPFQEISPSKEVHFALQMIWKEGKFTRMSCHQPLHHSESFHFP